MESIAAFLGSGCSSRETEIMNEVLSRWARDTSRGACRRWDYSCAAGCAAAPDLDAISQNGVLVVVVGVVVGFVVGICVNILLFSTHRGGMSKS